jgi:outer membrane protein assembly factor BamB
MKAVLEFKMMASHPQLIEDVNERLFRAWKLTAIMAGALCVAACVFMVAAHFRAKSQDPFKSPQLAALRADLQAKPRDDKLKEEIRALDLQLRQRYFRHLHFSSTGAWLSLGSAVLFLFAAQQAFRIRKQLPNPRPNPDAAEKLARAKVLSRWSVAGVGAMACVGLAAVAFSGGTALPTRLADLDAVLGGESPSEGGLANFASHDEMLRNWPRFRGLNGDGVAAGAEVPLNWDPESSVIWKVEVTLEGFNSPIVWGDRVFLSGGNDAGREVACYSARSGELLWKKTVEIASGSPSKTPEIPEHTGFAAATMATDGQRVYAIFANGDLAAFNFEGRQLWAKNLGVPKNSHGHASSLATWMDRVIVQYDQGDSEQNASKLFAFDGLTGRVVWQRSRPVGVSWATPIVIEAANKHQIITLSIPWLIAHAADTGAEIWRADGFSGEVAPSPIYAGGLVLAISPYDRMFAFKPDGKGEVTETHLAWVVEEGDIPDITTPASNDELVFILSTPGTMACYDLQEGAKQWEHEFETEFNASPSLVGRNLFLVTTKGEVIVIEAAREFRELARSNLGEKVYASPAFAGNRVFVRGLEHLYCIGTKEQALAGSN